MGRVGWCWNWLGRGGFSQLLHDLCRALESRIGEFPTRILGTDEQVAERLYVVRVVRGIVAAEFLAKGAALAVIEAAFAVVDEGPKAAEDVSFECLLALA